MINTAEIAASFILFVSDGKPFLPIAHRDDKLLLQ
jgi:hypothetical protein